MDLWHYPQKVNEKPGVMELWNFPNGQPLYQTSLEQEVDLITKDIHSITQDLSDTYQPQDVQRALSCLSNSTNPDVALAYNIIKQLIEVHYNSHAEEDEEMTESPTINDHQIEVEEDFDYDEEEPQHTEEVITTSMPFFSSPTRPEIFIPAAAPIASRRQQQPKNNVTNSQDSEFSTSQDEKSSPGSLDSNEHYMDRFDEYMFQDDFSVQPRGNHSRNNSGAEKYIPSGSRSRRSSKKRFHEESVLQAKQGRHEPQPTHIKKLARVKNNPNMRRFRNKKSYLTRREQWALTPLVGSPTNQSALSSGEKTPKGSISLDSTSVGRMKPEVDMNRNIPAFMFDGSPASRQQKQKQEERK